MKRNFMKLETHESSVGAEYIYYPETENEILKLLKILCTKKHKGAAFLTIFTSTQAFHFCGDVHKYVLQFLDNKLLLDLLSDSQRITTIDIDNIDNLKIDCIGRSKNSCDTLHISAKDRSWRLAFEFDEEIDLSDIL